MKMPLGAKVGLSPGDIVLDGDPAHLPKKEGTAAPNFRPMYGQTARWIKMPLGTKVGLGPDHHSVLDGTQLPQRGTTHNFWPMSVVTKLLDG